MPPSEKRLASLAEAQLREGGFVVEREARVTFGATEQSVQADLVAWAPDETGELVRDVVVEIAAGRLPRPKLALFSRIASIVGARRAFVFTGEWFAVDPSFSDLTPCPPPRPEYSPAQVRVPDSMIDEAVVRFLWRTADAMRSQQVAFNPIAIANSALDRLRAPRLPEVEGVPAVLRLPGVEQRIARMFADLGAFGRRGSGEWSTPFELASSLARLLDPASGMSVLDPFCGSGACLWAVAEEARRAGATVSLHGWELNESLRGYATKLDSLGKFAAKIEARLIPLPASLDSKQPTETFDSIVSVVPFNAVDGREYDLLAGGKTKLVDLAMLDVVGELLSPGGRAVLVVAPQLLFAEGLYARVRERLARTLRLVAVIELPGGVFPATTIQCGIVVLEKSQPTDTLIARLSDDWQAQLGDAGVFLRAYRDHLARRLST